MAACVASCVSKGSARSSGAVVSVSAGAVKPLVEQLEPVRRRLEPAESVGRLALASCVCKGAGVSCDGCCAALTRRDGAALARRDGAALAALARRDGAALARRDGAALARRDGVCVVDCANGKESGA